MLAHGNVASLGDLLGAPARTAGGRVAVPAEDLSDDRTARARKRVFADARRGAVVKYFLDRGARDHEASALRAAQTLPDVALATGETAYGLVCDLVPGITVHAAMARVDSLELAETLEQSFADLAADLLRAGLVPGDDFRDFRDLVLDPASSRMTLVNARRVAAAGGDGAPEAARRAASVFRKSLERAAFLRRPGAQTTE